MKLKINGNELAHTITSNYGEIGRSHPLPHTGIDFAMNEGTKLYSPVEGTVTKIVDYGDKNIGKGIFIETEDHHTVIMGHLSHAKAKIGQMVHQGDLVGYSGNTGHSTGPHLHLGMKDASGTFVNPQSLTSASDVPAPLGMVDGVKNAWDNITGFVDFTKSVGQKGFFQTVYGKSFFDVMKDFFAQLGHDLGMFILHNSDVIFLAPAIVLMFGTFVIGKNKYTKFIVPLWFTYFITSVLSRILS